MKKTFSSGLMTKVLLLSALLFGSTSWGATSAHATTIDTIRVGLYYDETRLPSANLANETGSGFRIGYYETDTTFVQLGTTQVESITMVRASNMYRSGNDFSLTGTSNPLGCYHIVHSTGYQSFASAQQVAQDQPGGFVAWINGQYQVRVGHYTTSEAAHAQAEGGSVAGTSSYAINMVKLGTTELIFQFDGGATKSLGIVPDTTGHGDPLTWFKNIMYRGAFRYQRVDQGDLTVVNILDLEPYVMGVIPYEMSPEWPIEALKAQAVSARTYAVKQAQYVNHKSENFDLCNTAHCQVYYGCGGPYIKDPSANSDQAVNETAGMYLWHGSTLAGTFYSSSHGGASESAANVWGSDMTTYPYLSGVVDPYEHMADSINTKSSWTVTFTKNELTEMLQGKGYGTDTQVAKLEAVYSEMGNVIQLVVHWENGKTNTLTTDHLRYTSWFALPSIRFAINEELPTNKVYPDGSSSSSGNNGSSGGSGGYALNEHLTLDTTQGTYALTNNGTQSTDETPFIITGTGTVEALSPTSPGTSTPSGGYTQLSGSHFATGDTYHFNGSGWGHNIGMSQFGAYAMAKEFGFDYDYILEFYFPGTHVGTG